MILSHLAQYSTEALALVLIVRIMALRIRLTTVYALFCAFVGFQALLSVTLPFLRQIQSSLDGLHFDYRLYWICTTSILWILSLWLVYALVGAILESFPGIWRFSRMLLNVILSLAFALGLLTIKPEIAASGAERHLSAIGRWYSTWIVLDRVISMTSVLVLAVVLGFILWFPVKMPRNLAVLSVGFVIYFGLKTAFRLSLSYLSALDSQSRELYSLSVNMVLAACFVYWILFITAQGQTRLVKIGHSWQNGEQDRLIGQLEALNASLLRVHQR